MRLVSTSNALEFELPALPYAMDALEPHISRETLEYHYGKHHLTYVEKLNALVANTRLENKGLEEIIRTSTGSVFNNAAQVWNHSFYWECMTPKGGGDPGGDVGRAIRSTFKSFEEFRALFKKHAVENFGSGWTWLVKAKDGSLVVRNTDDADTPLRTGESALLTCDVWEHAYYIDYRNERAKYVDAFWQVVNWRFVERNFTQG
jgi:superoxide dismutase, Fe-Mn family